MTTCPMCAEDIGAKDAVCPHCGSLLTPPPTVKGPRTAAADTRTVPASAGPSGVHQWVIPGVLAVAVVLALAVKFAWWDRRWQGTREACQVVTVLADSFAYPSRAEMDVALRAYFAGNREVRSAFALEIAMLVGRRNDRGTLRTHGIPAGEVEALYVAALQSAGVSAEAARETFHQHRAEVLRFVPPHAAGLMAVKREQAALRAVARGCSSGASVAATTVADVAAPNVAVQPTPAPAPQVALPPPARPTPPAPPVAAPATAPERLVPTATSASSFVSNGRNQYAPDRAFDGDPATTWTEAARGPGDGEWLQATFAGPQLVQRVRITTGWNHTSPRGEDLFTANSHLRRVRLVLGPNSAVERDVGAGQREVVFDSLDAETATVRIEAVSVWPGTRWADLCVGEVVIEGEPLANGPVAPPAADEDPRADGEGTRPCRYATRESFHLRASPTASRAGAVEITANPVVELLHAERLRRGGERMFQVRLPDGREGWMFVPEGEVPAGCEQ